LNGVPVFRSPQVILLSDDLPPAAAFYESLGFVETFRTPADGEPIHASAGIPALKPPHQWLGRLLIAWIADPDGNPVQIVQEL
jgi:hypothetical protein